MAYIDKNGTVWLPGKEPRKGSERFDYGGRIRSIGFSPNGKMFAMAHDKKKRGKQTTPIVTIFDVRSGEAKLEFEYATTTVFSPDSKYFLTRGKLHEIATGQEVASYQSEIEDINAYCFSSDGKLLAAVGEWEVEEYSDGSSMSITVWEVMTGKKIWERRAGLCKRAVFSRDSSKLYVAAEGDVNRWHTSDIDLYDITKDPDQWPVRVGEKGFRFWSLAISPDGKTLIGSGDYRESEVETPIIVWNADTLEEIGRLEGHVNTVWCLAYDPHGKFAVSGSSDHTARVWDVEKGIQLHEFRDVMFTIDHVTVSPGGILATTGWHEGPHFYDVAKGKEIWKTRPAAKGGGTK